MTSTTEYIVFGMGCFWGAQKRLQQLQGVLHTECGYACGDSWKLPVTYERILATEKRQDPNHTNYAEVIKVEYDPKLDLEQLLAVFWQNHNPTQLNQQGNDVGSNYRSGIYYTNAAQCALASNSKTHYQQKLQMANFGSIVTEILPLTNYVTAETYHQDYLAKNPHGYCGLGGLGIAY